MDLKRLRTFVAVAEQGAVSKAAELLHVTQPALSRQIVALESELGFALFQRSGRRLVPSPRGEQLLAHARDLLDHAAALAERARTLQQGEMRELKVAASALTVGALFPSFLGRYRTAFPDVHLALVEADMTHQLAMLERGDAHVAMAVLNAIDVDERRFGVHLLPEFHLQAACARRYRIEAAGTIEIKRLAQHPLLVLDRHYATRGVFDAACQLARVRPTIVMESTGAEVLTALAEVGHGIAVIPSIHKTDPRRIRTMRVTHRRAPLALTLAVTWDRRRTLPHYAQGFADLMTAHVEERYGERRR